MVRYKDNSHKSQRLVKSHEGVISKIENLVLCWKTRSRKVFNAILSYQKLANFCKDFPTASEPEK